MSNKKVYLAKNILASGFDVEYVKSSLLRIPGIDIVEAGMSISPSECEAFVIVADDDFVLIDDESLSLSKNVSKDLKEFLRNSAFPCPWNCVYIYSHQEDVEDWDDAESTYARILSLDNDEVTTVDKSDYDHYAQIGTSDDGMDLLTAVSADINVDVDKWTLVKRHPQPKPEYAMPPVPSLEERRLKKCHISDEVGQWHSNTIAYWENKPFSFSVSGDNRLLLLRRK